MIEYRSSSILHLVGHSFSAMSTLAERVTAALEDADITQAVLAERCDVSAQAVSQWLNGTTKNLRPDHLFKAARALGVSPEWLGCGVGPMKEEAAWYGDRPPGAQALRIARMYDLMMGYPQQCELAAAADRLWAEFKEAREKNEQQIEERS